MESQLIKITTVEQLENYIFTPLHAKEFIKKVMYYGGVVYYNTKTRAMQFENCIRPIAFARQKTL